MIYLDNAATSFHKPKEVFEAVYDAMQGVGNSGRGVHGASLSSSRIIYKVRVSLSKFFNTEDPSHVVLTSNATESLNIVIQGLLKSGDHCISTVVEHNSVLRPLYYMKNCGVELTLVGADNKGCISVSDIEGAIRLNTKAIVINHASNVTGNLTDIESIGRICSKHNILFILDASQTAGLIPIDMKKNNISALCCSGHKSLLGPQGTGALCLAKGIKPSPLKFGGTGTDSFSHSMPDALPASLEAGTLNTHGFAGLLASLDYLLEYGQNKIYSEVTDLMNYFVENIIDIPKIRLYGDFDAQIRTPVVSLNIGSIDSGEISDELFNRFGIATRAGAHCAPMAHELFGTVNQGMVRFSFSHFNTFEEVNSAINALKVLREERK